MARTSKDPASITKKTLDNLPDGVRVVNFEATVGDGDNKKKGVVISAVMPEYGNAEGLRNYVSLYSSEARKDDEDGVAFATGAIRSAIRSAVARYADPENLENSVQILPPPTDIRTVDPAEMAGARLTQWLKEHPGQQPPADVVASFYSDVTS